MLFANAPQTEIVRSTYIYILVIAAEVTVMAGQMIRNISSERFCQYKSTIALFSGSSSNRIPHARVK